MFLRINLYQKFHWIFRRSAYIKVLKDLDVNCLHSIRKSEASYEQRRKLASLHIEVLWPVPHPEILTLDQRRVTSLDVLHGRAALQFATISERRSSCETWTLARAYLTASTFLCCILSRPFVDILGSCVTIHLQNDRSCPNSGLICRCSMQLLHNSALGAISYTE